MTLKTKLVCDVLVRDGLIKPDQAQAAAARLQWSGERIEEAILDLGMLSEADLLRSLAAYYKANFISAEKLAKAEVARSLLDTIPQRFAENVGVCPVVYDAKSHVLSVVTADPDDLESLRELQLASGAREVRAVLARPAAVKALIAKAYGGDARAFASFERYMQVATGPVVYERSSSGERKVDARGHGGGERTFDEKDFERGAAPKPAPAPSPPTAPPKPKVEPAPAPRPPRADGTMSGTSFVELLHILVNLLEGSRGDLRGHSAVVARLMRRMGEKLGLEGSQIAVLVAAAFIHDLGKMGTYHLTTLNCSEYDGHKAAAQKAFGVPSRLLEPVRLPNDTLEAVGHMYERYDGKGFPDGIAGKEIPLGARILAICDTYADITNNPRNPFRATLSPEDACAGIAKHKETIFDPNLVDLFKNTVLGEERAARLLAARTAALIVDVDPEEATILELRMSEQGFVVKTARTSEQALKLLADGTMDLVVSEIDLGSASGDGLTLLAAARAEAWGKDVPWVIYTRRQERALAQRAFELGVLDYVTKPAPADVLVAKLKALLAQRAAPGKSGGVSGSLKEMGLPDMVQVLFHSRKSGSLKIRAREGAGEIHFVEGAMVDALWRDLRGEDAFYAMLKLNDGDFSLDPAFRTTARSIHQSSEALLLEGMRRVDEGLA